MPPNLIRCRSELFGLGHPDGPQCWVSNSRTEQEIATDRHGRFVVLCGRYGDVTRSAHDREQSRQSLYREASPVANAVDENRSPVPHRRTPAATRAGERGSNPRSPGSSGWSALSRSHATNQDEFASVAQAEGVSREARRGGLLQVVAGVRVTTAQSVPTLGQGHRGSWPTPASCSK